jgi:peptidyl-tRNA hydrolase
MTIQILGGSTSQTVRLFIQDTSKTDGSGLTGLVHNTSGLTAYYSKGATGTATSITLATQTAGGAWSSGGFVAVDGTNMPGVYRLDLPNAAIDSEVETIVMLRGAANMAPVLLRVKGDKVQANAVTVADKTGYSLATAPPTAAAIADAVYDEMMSEHTINGTYGSHIVRSANQNQNTVAINGNNHIAAAVHTVEDNAITAAAIADSAVTEIQSGLATLDNQRFQLSIMAGATSNAASAAELYVFVQGGSTYTVTFAGLDATGNRGTASLVKT